MKYSIIVPVYNSGDFIIERLESLLNHPATHYEVIAVDDGSTDHTLEFLKQKEKTTERLTVITQKNAGPSGARNTGLKQARGDYILFADADDFLNIEILDYMETFTNDIELFIFNYFIDNGEEIVPKKMFYPHKSQGFHTEDILYLYLDGFIHTLWNKVYKRQIIQDNSIQFNESLRMGEDLLFNLDYLEYCQNLHFSKETFYTYSEDSIGSVSKELPENYFDNQIYIFNQVLEFFEHKKELIDEEGIQKLQANFMINVSNYMKKAAAAYDKETFTQLMKDNILSDDSKVLLNRVSMKELSRAQKVIYGLIKTRQFKVIYKLYIKFKINK